jgi:hypothetical protein
MLQLMFHRFIQYCELSSGGWPCRMSQCAHGGPSLLPLLVLDRSARSQESWEKSFLLVMLLSQSLPLLFWLCVLVKLLGAKKSR